jgi:hypothetical protein
MGWKVQDDLKSKLEQNGKAEWKAFSPITGGWDLPSQRAIPERSPSQATNFKNLNR